MQNKRNALSRRDMLKLLGAGTLGLGVFGLGNLPAQAQISATEGTEDVYYRFKLGNADLIVVSSAAGALAPAIFGANQPEEEVVAFFENLGVLRNGQYPNTFLNLVMVADGVTTVFDTGLEPGRTARTIQTLGLTPDNVIITHFHPDHIGALSMGGELTYPGAQVFFSQPEYDFLQNAPASVAEGPLAKLQPALDNDQVSFYNDGDEIAPGITAMATHGHTPGHMSLLLENDGQTMLHFVDAVLNAFGHVQNPGWAAAFDGDPEMAVATRRRLLDMAATDRMQMMGYHFPFPGLGLIVPNGDDSYLYVPNAV